jgi:uncharacterized protein with PIN domain
VRVFLTCLDCGGEFSATSGDYFMLDPDEVLECSECGGPLSLVTERKVQEIVYPQATRSKMQSYATLQNKMLAYARQRGYRDAN